MTSSDGKTADLSKCERGRTVYLVGAKDDPVKVSSFFNGVSCQMPAHCVVVFFGMEVPKYLVRVGLEVKSSEDYLSKSDCEGIDEYVYGGITKSWYLYKDITLYRGIHLGKIFEYELQKYLTPRLKNLQIIKNAITQHKAGNVAIVGDSDELFDAAKLCARLADIPFSGIELNRKEGFFSEIRPRARAVLLDFIRGALDYFSYSRLKKGAADKEVMLIDAKLKRQLSHLNEEGKRPFLVVCPFENGLSARLDLIRNGNFYLPLCFGANKAFCRDWAAYQTRWRELSLDREFTNTFEYKGIHLWGLFSGKLADFFLEGIPRMINNINMLDKAAGSIPIKSVILRNDVKELERTVILGLRLRNIPSLVIQHGILAETNGHNILLADKFAAWGVASKQWYGRFGDFSDKIEITGNPRFDSFLNWKPQLSRDELCERLNLNKNSGIILFVTQQINKFSSFWTEDLFWVITNELLEAMRLFPDKQLIIKADPYEDLMPYNERISAKECGNAIAVKDVDIKELLYFSDLVITQDSTAGLEAMLFDKPLITVNLTKRRDRIPYAEKAAALGVYNAVDLVPAIERIFTEQETAGKLAAGRKIFVEEFAHKLDGKAGERVSYIINGYAGNDSLI